MVASSPTATEAGPSAVTDSAAGAGRDVGGLLRLRLGDRVVVAARDDRGHGDADGRGEQDQDRDDGQRQAGAPGGSGSSMGGAGGSGLETMTSGSAVCTST